MALNDSCFCWQLEKLQLHSQLSSPEEKQLPENVMPSFWESSRRAVIVNLICFWWFGGNLTLLFLHFSRLLAKKKLLLMHQTVEWSGCNGKLSNLPFICIYDRFSYAFSLSVFTDHFHEVCKSLVKAWVNKFPLKHSWLSMGFPTQGLVHLRSFTWKSLTVAVLCWLNCLGKIMGENYSRNDLNKILKIANDSSKGCPVTVGVAKKIPGNRK